MRNEIWKRFKITTSKDKAILTKRTKTLLNIMSNSINFILIPFLSPIVMCFLFITFLLSLVLFKIEPMLDFKYFPTFCFLIHVHLHQLYLNSISFSFGYLLSLYYISPFSSFIWNRASARFQKFCNFLLLLCFGFLEIEPMLDF
jgi:hypothetical protein